MKGRQKISGESCRHPCDTVCGRGGYQKQIDRLLELWVVVEDIAVPQLRHLVARFGALLGQEAMYFEVGTSTVEFIPLLPQENQTDDQRGGAAPTS